MKKFKSILLIDDDEICSWLNKTLLEEMEISHEVKCVYTVTEALAYLSNPANTSEENERPCPDLILVDINLPGMNGFDFLDQLQTLEHYLHPGLSNTKIVILTSSMHPHDIEQASSYAIHAYLVKPLTEAKLKTILTEGDAVNDDRNRHLENGGSNFLNGPKSREPVNRQGESARKMEDQQPNEKH